MVEWNASSLAVTLIHASLAGHPYAMLALFTTRLSHRRVVHVIHPLVGSSLDGFGA
jgi:hypothetical protein